MDRSDKLDELGKALARAQASITDATKSSRGQARGGSYKYATLGDVWDACRTPLSENGLSVLQYAQPSEDPNVVLLVTMLLHESGQFITGTESMPLMGEPNPQTYGSAMTYARRYGLAAMLGIVADDDDDGAAASQGSGRQQGRSAPAAQRPPATQRPRDTTPESTGDRAASQTPPRAEQAVQGGEKHGSFTGASNLPATPATPSPTDPAPRAACSRPDCGKPLTKGQHDVSIRAFGLPLCPACQKTQARAGA